MEISALLKLEAVGAAKKIDKERKNEQARLDAQEKILCKKYHVNNISMNFARFYSNPELPPWSNNAKRVGPLKCPICEGSGEVSYFDEDDFLEGFIVKGSCYECKGSGKLYFIHGSDSTWGESDSDRQIW